MEAIGMIETKGLLAAIESSDAMLKAAEVRLLDRTFVGGGLVTITVTGDVAAVKASVDAGAAAVTKLGAELLISQHVIPRPHSELNETILPPTPLSEINEAEPEPEFEDPQAGQQSFRQSSTAEMTTDEPEAEQEEQENEAEEAPVDDTEPREHDSSTNVAEMHKEDMDRLVEKAGIDKAIETIEKCKVVKLRNLAREYEDFGIAGRLISKANKTALLEEFRRYYS